MEEIKLKGLNETIYYDECDNGLKIYMWKNDLVNTFYGTLSIKYGSLYNNFKINNKVYELPVGVPHFLEHVKFNEDKDSTAHDFFNKMGSDTNAFTTFNYTNYQVFGSDNPKDNIIHLLDFVQNNYFSKKIISNEKGIIIEEANMGEDDPYTVMLYNLLDNLFNNYECSKVITGKKDDIKKIKLEDIKLAFNSFYHPSNMFLVVTGKINPYEIAAAVKENQKKKEFIKYSNPERIIKRESKKVKKAYEERNLNVTNKKISIGIKIPKKLLKEFDDLHIKIYLSLLLKANFGSTSEFKDKLITSELISDMTYIKEFFDDYIAIMFLIDSEYEEEIIKLFKEKLANLEIDEKIFIRMQKASIATTILEYEDVEIVNSRIQSFILDYDKIIDNLKEEYENISYEDILRFNKLLNLDERSILIIKPLK